MSAVVNLPSSRRSRDSDDSLDDDVQQWRHELEQLVRRTVTVRARNSRAYRQLFRQAARCKMYDIEVRTAAAYFQRYNHQTPPTQTQPPTSTVPSPAPGTTTARRRQQTRRSRWFRNWAWCGRCRRRTTWPRTGCCPRSKTPVGNPASRTTSASRSRDSLALPRSIW